MADKLETTPEILAEIRKQPKFELVCSCGMRTFVYFVPEYIITKLELLTKLERLVKESEVGK